jgi:hypothetical protein
MGNKLVGWLRESGLRDGCGQQHLAEQTVQWKAADEIERLNGEVEALLSTVESVRVCRDHTWEITAFDGCVICEIEQLRDWECPECGHRAERELEEDSDE